MLVISLAYAGVLSYYGKIVGTASIQPPIFYADSTSLGGVYYKMKINEAGTGSVTLQDGGRILFVTDPLGISSWYPTKWNVYIKVFTPDTGGGLSAIRIKKVSQNFLTEYTICEWTGISLKSGENSIQNTCTPEQVNFDTTERLGLEIVGAGTLTYTIFTDGSTRILFEVLKEVSK